MMSSSGMNVSFSISTKRGSTSFGTFTRAYTSAPLNGSRRCTQRLSDRFEMYGNGRPGPIARGVSAGKMCSPKWLAIRFGEAPDSSIETIRMPSSASAGLTTSLNCRDWRTSSSTTRRRIPARTSVGDSPSAPRASIRASI